MDKGELVIKSEDKRDIISKTKTIYEAGAGEIFLNQWAQSPRQNPEGAISSPGV